MSRLARRALWVAISLLGIGWVAWLARVEIVLLAVGILVNVANPVAPSGEIVWSQPPPRASLPPRSEGPPNVVLIVTDDLGWNDISLNGGVADGTVPTPNIDSIAREGVNLTQGYSGSATCAPSRAALMSGRYGTRFGFEFTPVLPGMMPIITMIRNSQRLEGPPSILDEGEQSDEEGTALGLPPSEITLAELLKDQGYYTAHIGKWHLGRGEGMMPLEQGFDDSLLMNGGMYARPDDPRVVDARQDFDPIDRFLWRATQFSSSFNGGEAFELPTYMTDAYSAEAVEVIERNRDRPFFLYLAYFAPHNPLQARRDDYDALGHIDLHRERVYGAMMRSLDRGVGEVLEALRSNGIEDNTLVIFTSDNGGAGYIGLPDLNRPYRGWKSSYFEGGIHVPFLARWPDAIPAGTVYVEPVHHFDIFATAAAAAGAELPSDRTIDGVDLLPHLRGETPDPPHRALFWRNGAAKSVRRGSHKLILSEPPGGTSQEWLFDFSVDPYERTDIAAENPELVAELRAELEAHYATQPPPAWAPYVHAPINVDRDQSQPSRPDDDFAYWSN